MTPQKSIASAMAEGEYPVFGRDYLHPCALHEDDEGWYSSDDALPYCPDCGTTLNIDYCVWCGANWLSYGEGRDDVSADAMVTNGGDLCCAACYREEDEFNNYIEDLDDDYLFEMAGTTKMEATAATPTERTPKAEAGQ